MHPYLNTLSTLIGQLTWHPQVPGGHSERDEGGGLTVQGPHQHNGSGTTADVEVHHSIARCCVCDRVGDDTPGTGVRVHCRHLWEVVGVCEGGRCVKVGGGEGGRCGV